MRGLLCAAIAWAHTHPAEGLMRRLVDASRVRVPVPVRSQPRWSRRIPTRIAHGIGHDHAWVFMDSIGNKAVNPKLAESAPNLTLLGVAQQSPSRLDFRQSGSGNMKRTPWPLEKDSPPFCKLHLRVLFGPRPTASVDRPGHVTCPLQHWDGEWVEATPRGDGCRCTKGPRFARIAFTTHGRPRPSTRLAGPPLALRPSG